MFKAVLALRFAGTVSGALLLAAAAHADNLNKDWDNGAADNAFENATNWNADTLPTTGTGNIGDNLRIDRTGTNKAVYSATVDNPGVGATSANAGVFRSLSIAAVSGNGELEFTGGFFATDNTTQTTIGSSRRTGILTVNGASANVRLGGWLSLGHSTGGTGLVNIVSGSFTEGRNGTVGGIPGVSIALGNGNNARGAIKMSGGQLVTRTGVLLGVPGTTGVGRFEVRGGGVASIGTDNAADDGFWVQSSGSVLAAYVDHGTLGTIHVDAVNTTTEGTYADGNVIFMPGSKLELGFVDSVTNAGSWDLMTWDGALLTNGLSLVSGTDTNWSFAFVDTDGVNGPDTLRITYISPGPPPPPTGLVAVPGNGQVTLRWSALSGATNYNLKRATSPGGPYTSTNSTSGLSFTNTGLVNGATYYYVISGVATNRETLNSNEVRATPQDSKFVHPGVIHTQADLDRIRTKVEANEQPWAEGYAGFSFELHSSATYPMQGPMATIVRGPALPSQWENDCAGAWQNAMMWYITGDPDHAAKAIQILDAWASTCTGMSGSDARLTAGLQGHKYIAAAEIIRYTGAPWSPAQMNTCSNFIRTVLLPQNKMYGGGNWGNIGAISQMAAGVFMEDEAEFNDAVNAMKYGAPTECDMGMVNYIDPQGWTTEADRDLGHWSLGLNNIGVGAHIAWCQGVDLWTFLGNRLLAGHEYIVKYNLSNSVPYSPVPQCDGMNNGGITSIGRGRFDLIFLEQAFHPYQNLFGLDAPWTWAGVTNTRNYFLTNSGFAAELYDRDHVGFGTLVFALPTRAAGLPVLPSGLAASASNGVVRLTWTAAPAATGYKVKRAVSRGGPYTTLATLAATSCTDSSVANNQLYFYKVAATNAVGETADSGLAAAYPSSTAPAAPTDVAARAISHQRIDVSWKASVGATSYNVKRAIAPGGPFTSLATGIGTNFLTCADTGLPSATPFYYVVTANNALGTGVDSAIASATTLPALPLPWTFADAGYLTTPGQAAYAGGAFTVKGAGLDYGGYNSDSFGFAYLNLAGDGEIIARYASRQNYSQICKTGIAMRESLAGDSRHAFVFVGGDDTANFIYRSSTGANGSSSGSTNVPGSALPCWLKLNRTGQIFTGSVSPDGANWTVINSRSLAMSANLLVGLAVCSRNNGFLDTAVFDNVSVTGLWPVSQTPPHLDAAWLNGQLHLSWPSTHLGWRLESQTNAITVGLGSNWVSVPGSQSTNQVFLPVDPANGSVFFRLTYP